jgi:hypothetical protein
MSRISLATLVVLSSMRSQTSSMLSIYKSTQPWRGRGRSTDAGSAVTNNADMGMMDGGGYVVGSGVGANVVDGD